jgi:hypothetical protein
MARDPSYAEYVDARWSMLYRLASLLAGEERAQDVTARTLGRAYLGWTEVGEVASADEHLEEMLAQAAIDESVSGGGDTGFDALPVRQRAAVVLRCIALLSDVEIARALGCRPSDVEALVSEAVVRLGTSLPGVTAELERRSEEVGVPPAPIESLLARGQEERSRRRRRILTWVIAAAAAVVAVPAVTALVHAVEDELHRRSVKPIPATLVGLATGPASRVAYVEGHTLHLEGGGSVELRETPDVVVQAAVWVYVVYPSGTIERVQARSLATTTVTTTSAGQVVADPSGRYVAWVEAKTGTRRPVVVVRAIGSEGETRAQQERAFPAGPDPFVLVGIDRNADVFGSRPAQRDGIWVWRSGLVLAPGRRVFDRVFGAGNGVLAQVVNGHLVVNTGGAFDVGELHGTNLVYDEEVSGAIADFADPSARRVAQVDATANGSERNGVWVMKRTDVRDPEPPRPRLRVPTDATIVDVRWEDAGHVLVDVSDPTAPNGALVRCDVGTGDCELATRFDGPHLLAD